VTKRINKLRLSHRETVQRNLISQIALFFVPTSPFHYD
jgi:hypothetical protein